MTIVGIFFWIGTINLSPDSSTYISVANNLKNYGELFKWVNWPSGIMYPQTEPFTDFAPGLMFLSYPFVLVTNDPLNAIIILQSLLIMFYGIVVYKLVNQLFGNSIMSYMLGSTMLLFPLFTRIETYFWSELPFISLTLLAIYYVIKFTKTEKESTLLKAAIVIMISCIFKYIGVFNISLLLVLYFSKKIELQSLVKFSIISVLGIASWFIRNYIVYGSITRSHSDSGGIDFSSVTSLFDKLNSLNFALPYFSVAILIAVLAFLFSPYLMKNKVNFNYKLLLTVSLFHLFGIVFLSLFTNFDSLGARLLSPSVALITVLIAVIIFDWGLKEKTTIKKLIVGAYTVLLFGFNYYTLKPNITSDKTLNEKKLWEYIRSDKDLNKSSHFYSEFNLNHELYCNIPLRVVYSEDSLRTEYVNNLLKIGNNSFFIYKKDGIGSAKMDLLLDNCGLNVIDTFEFKIYYLEGE